MLKNLRANYFFVVNLTTVNIQKLKVSCFKWSILGETGQLNTRPFETGNGYLKLIIWKPEHWSRLFSNTKSSSLGQYENQKQAIELAIVVLKHSKNGNRNSLVSQMVRYLDVDCIRLKKRPGEDLRHNITWLLSLNPSKINQLFLTVLSSPLNQVLLLPTHPPNQARWSTKNFQLEFFDTSPKSSSYLFKKCIYF